MSEQKVFREFTQNELDTQYDQSTLVPDIAPYVEQWEELTAQAVADFTVHRDLRYGGEANQRLDLFEAQVPDAPLVVFFHGGAWMRHTKDLFGYPALALIPNGFAFATVEFDLIPDVRAEVQVNHALLAFEWLAGHGEAYGYSADRMFVAGHASGALLAGMVAATDWRTRLKRDASPLAGALLLSGIYDLEPVRLSSRNEPLALTAKEARALSPIHQIPPSPCPIVVAWGEAELNEYRRQSQEFAAAWRRADGPCSALEIPGANHFEMSLELCDPNGPLVQSFQELCKSASPKQGVEAAPQ
ncbi:MAG: alpha/beta hydrolase fold domain-containing protein [Gammaproteobacteria bacterium]|nr:alpha/beta hydrolase fold domain-containing protein [Gammaproteobacteria bacterium]